jgi:hypothetical protein
MFGEIDAAHAAAAKDTLDAVLSADDRAGIKVARGDEQSAVVLAVGVMTGVRRGAERTSFHRLDSPFKTLPKWTRQNRTTGIEAIVQQPAVESSRLLRILLGRRCGILIGRRYVTRLGRRGAGLGGRGEDKAVANQSESLLREFGL